MFELFKVEIERRVIYFLSSHINYSSIEKNIRQHGFYFFKNLRAAPHINLVNLTHVVHTLRTAREPRGVVINISPTTTEQFGVSALDPHNAWGQERTGGSTEHFSGKYSAALKR